VKRLIIICLIVSLFLSGCSWMNGEYVSVSPHQLGYSSSNENMPIISNYAELRSALTTLIDSGNSSGLFVVADYFSDRLEADTELAVSYASNHYPIGAFAVDSIDYEFGTSGGQPMLAVDITYRRSAAEIANIRTVRGISGATSAIAEALNNCEDSLILQITGYSSTDFVQLIADYAADNPNLVMELPQVATQLYPNQGNVRVLELQFSYQTSRESLRFMQNQVRPVFSSAALYVSSEAEDYTRFVQLHTFLMERFDYTLETSITPAYSLLCHGVGDSKAFAQVYASMCRRSGLDCVSVSGTYNGESRFWNIIRIDGIYYHLDLLQCAQSGAFEVRADDEMSGYVWDYSAYPPCGEAAGNTEPSE